MGTEEKMRVKTYKTFTHFTYKKDVIPNWQIIAANKALNALIYPCNNDSTFCELALACDNIEVPACCNICALLIFDVSAAKSAS